MTLALASCHFQSLKQQIQTLNPKPRTSKPIQKPRFYKQNTNTGRCQLLFPRPLAFSHTAPVPLCPHLSTHGIVNLSPAECADAFE